MRLEGVASVGHVELAGLPAQEVTVAIDLDRMVALGVSPYELIAAIGADAQNLPAGSVELGSRRFNVKTSGDYASVTEIEDTVVRSSAAGVIKVRDIAQVQLGDSEAASIARFDGKRAVLVDVAMRDGGNLLELRPRLGARGLQSEFAAGYQSRNRI
jgi:multidrug efflux pump subunit AcrB